MSDLIFSQRNLAHKIDSEGLLFECRNTLVPGPWRDPECSHMGIPIPARAHVENHVEVRVKQSKTIHKIAHFGPLEVHFMEDKGCTKYLYSEYDDTVVSPKDVTVGIQMLVDSLNKTWPEVITSAPRITYYDESDNPESKANEND